MADEHAALRAKRGPFYVDWLGREIKSLERRARRHRAELRRLLAQRDEAGAA